LYTSIAGTRGRFWVSLEEDFEESYEEDFKKGFEKEFKEDFMIKICGLKNAEEAKWVAEAGADFAGMVLFFPKSKRNIDIETAKSVMSGLGNRVKSVAVTVTPSLEQIRAVEAAGFDYLQYHGKLEEDLLTEIDIPIIKAFNVKDVSDIKTFVDNERIVGFVFDANAPGSGMGFDYAVLESVRAEIEAAEANGKFVLLAGGLGPDNVAQALKETGFKGVDTSSGVENEAGDGKSRDKIFSFVENAQS